MTTAEFLSTEMIAKECNTALIFSDGEQYFVVKLNHLLIIDEGVAVDCGDLCAIDRHGNVLEMPETFTVLKCPAITEATQ